MIDGKRVHSVLFNEYYRNASLHDKLNTIILKTQKDQRPRKIRELLVSRKTEKYELVGKIDEVRIEPGRIILIDDKKIDYLSPIMEKKYRQQLELYAELFFENYFPFLDVFIELRQAITEKTFFLTKFDTISFDLNSVIELILDYWNGEVFLQETTDVNKCRTCRFFGFCK